MASDQTRIRTGLPADAELIAALAARTFRQTFADDNAIEDVESYVRDAFTLDRVRAELRDDRERRSCSPSSMAKRSRPGMPSFERGTMDPSVTGPSPLELQRLYVDRSALGHGVGAALMRASLDVARSGGHQTIWLGVWERNARAIAFYERWQFVAVGEHVFRLGSDDQRDLIMTRPVPEAA